MVDIMMRLKWQRDECTLLWHVIKTTMSCRGAKMLMVMVLASYALTSLSPYLNGQFVDTLVYGQDMHAVYILAFAIALMGISTAVFSYFAKMLQTSVLNLSYFKFLKEIVSDFQHLPLADIESASLLYSAQKINSDTSSVTSFVVINTIPLFMNALTMIAAILLIGSLDLSICIVGMTLLGAYCIMVLMLQAPLLATSFQKKEEDGFLFSSIASRIERTFEIKLLAGYNSSFEHVEKQFDDAYYPSVLALAKVQNILSSGDRMAAAGFQAVLLLISGARIATGAMTIGEFTMINSYYSLLMSCSKYYVGVFQSLQDTRASIARLNEIKARKKDYRNCLEVNSVGRIQVLDLDFSLIRDEGLVDIACGVNLQFDVGKTYVITGPNGAGKSTLLKLLLGFYEHANCNIEYDHTKLTAINLDRARSECFSAMQQAGFVSGDTVEDYLHEYGISYESMAAFLKECGFESFDKIRWEKCSNLSGGELQRLRLAMTLYREADFVVLDEPTNDLDGLACDCLIEYVKQNKRGQAFLIASHDSRLLDVADHILVMNGEGAIELAK